MTNITYFHFVLVFMSFLILVSIPGEANARTDTDESENKNEVYIVYMGSASNLKEGRAPRTDHIQLLNEHEESWKYNSVVQIYNSSFVGLAVRLSPEEATLIAGRPGVVSVFKDSHLQLHTTRSWDFLMSQSPLRITDSTRTSSHSNGSEWSRGGRDTIIGIVDTGIWPHHPSFNDEFMGPIPERWNGTCMTDNNNSTTAFTCNRKVIGARYYDDHEDPGSITTAMDWNGHGTHVASTAAGVPVNGASYYGLAKGVASGGSPYSRIAIYNVCGTKGCVVSSILKAFDDAIADGVDVISVSLGGECDSFFTDPVAIGAFHAMEKGVIVVASAGNYGPSSGTVLNYSPWILTVGATTIDRDFEVGVVLGGRKEMIIKGGGINFSGLNKSPVYQLVDGRSAGHNQSDSFNATHCFPGSLEGAKVKGRIVLCIFHGTFRGIFHKIDAMKEQGVIGIIMISDSLRQWTDNFNTSIAFASVSTADGARIQSYINSTKNPLATILPTETIINHKPAPVVATFSSRGPTPDISNLLKPDVTAPGVSILAAWRFNDTSETFPGKLEPPLFNLASGTSMSCPHVSGLAAIVKSSYPKSTPSAIRSAIMTTAIQNNNLNAPITNLSGSRATPYDIGAGEISIFGPLCPGLVYETETIDYILFLCNMGYNNTAIKILSSTVPDNFSCPRNSSPDLISDMNYPSIAVSGLKANVKKTVKRTVTNVGPVNSNYRVTVEAPAGVVVKVVPNTLQFMKHVKKLSFQVTFILTTTSLHEDLFGWITWSSDNNFYNVRSPIVVSKA